MRLQKRFSRRIGKTEYIKWVLNIPPAVIEALGWKQKEELESEVKGDLLIIKRKTQ